MATVDRFTPPNTTHQVVNQPPPLLDHNAFDADPALQAALEREGGAWGMDRVRDFGAVVASSEADGHRRRAQRNTPILHQHDRFGHRIDEVEYDPSMHWMLRLGVEREANSLAWRDPRAGSQVVRYALFYLMNQLDTGPCSPKPALQRSLLLRDAPPAVADAFCARLADGRAAFGTLPRGVDAGAIVERALAL